MLSAAPPYGGPQSTTTRRGSAPRAVRTRSPASGGHDARPSGNSRNPPRHGISRRRSASAGAHAPVDTHSLSPGPSGSGNPSTAGQSPPKSASRTSRPDVSARTLARAAATTVVPLPPLVDQQAISTEPLPGRVKHSGGGRAHGEGRAAGLATQGVCGGRPVEKAVGVSLLVLLLIPGTFVLLLGLLLLSAWVEERVLSPQS